MDKILVAKTSDKGEIVHLFVPKEDGLCAYCEGLRHYHTGSHKLNPRCALFNSELKVIDDKAYKCDECLSSSASTEFVANTDEVLLGLYKEGERGDSIE